MIFVPQIHHCTCSNIADVIATKFFAALDSCKILTEKVTAIFKTKPEVNAEATSASLEKLRNIIEKFDEDSLTAKIVRSFGGLEAFKRIPHLNWNDRFGTEKFDGISRSDMTDSVMWGVDNQDRLFITLKTKKKTEERVLNNNGMEMGRFFSSSSPVIETFFQRNPQDGNIWTSGSSSREFKLVVSKMTDKEFVLFQTLINTKEVVFENQKDNVVYIYKVKLI